MDSLLGEVMRHCPEHVKKGQLVFRGIDGAHEHGLR